MAEKRKLFHICYELDESYNSWEHPAYTLDEVVAHAANEIEGTSVIATIRHDGTYLAEVRHGDGTRNDFSSSDIVVERYDQGEIQTYALREHRPDFTYTTN